MAQALALGWILARKMGSAVRLDQGVDNLARPLVQREYPQTVETSVERILLC